MRYLGLDLGSKSLGISSSDKSNTIASIYKTIFFKENDYDSLILELINIVKVEEISVIVLGLPKNMNNTIGTRAEITLEFKKKLEDSIGIKVELMDERLTSVISNDVLISANVSRKKRKKKVDGMAALLILQSYIDRKKNDMNKEMM